MNNQNTPNTASSEAPVLEVPKPKDAINPAHYQVGGIQAIEVIEAWELSFCLGNTVKYLQRHKHKNGLEDLKKAHWYLERAIKQMEDAQAKDNN